MPQTAIKSPEDFLLHYLSLPQTGKTIYFPKSDDIKVVRDEWRIIAENLGLSGDKEFIESLTSLWMAPGRIRWCPQIAYQEALTTLKEGHAYECLRHFRRLAHQGFYIEFPVILNRQDVPREWKRIIEYTLFNQQLESKFYDNMANFWQNYLDRAIELLRKGIRELSIERFANTLFFLATYGFDMRQLYRCVLDEISFEALDGWEKLLALRAKRLQLDDHFDPYSQVMMHLLATYDSEKNVKQAIQNSNELEFLEEYLYLSEAGYKMKFPLYVNDFHKIKPVWEEVLPHLGYSVSSDFINKLTRLWIGLITPLAQKHTHWSDELVYELIQALEKRKKISPKRQSND